MSSVRRTGALVAVVLLLGAGCSESQTDEAETTPTSMDFIPDELDRPGYIQAVNDICTNPDLGGDIGDPVGSDSTLEAVDTQLDEIETRLDLMLQMPVPTSDEEQIDEIVQSYDRVLTALGELSTAVDEDDTQAAILVSSVLDGLRARTNELVANYGIDACTL